VWKTSKARLVTAKVTEDAVNAKSAATQSNGTAANARKSGRSCNLEEPINCT